MLWFPSFKILVQTSNRRFARHKMKIHQSAKALVEKAVEDKTGPNSWALSAALFVRITGTQEKQPRSKQEEKLGSEATSFPSACLPQSAVGQAMSVSGQGPGVAWRPSVIDGPHKRDARCWHRLQHLWPAPVCAVAENFFGASFSVPLFPLLSQVWAERRWPWDPVRKWTPPNSFWVLLSSRRGKEIPILSEILHAMKTQQWRGAKR